jgi:GAF domain-containing protein
VSVATSDDELKFVTATDASVVDIEAVQERHQEGPCVEAFRTGEIVTVSDIAGLQKWHPYRAAAADSGWKSVVGLPLSLDEHRVGSLNVYDRRVRDWSVADLDAARALADIATAYLTRAGELAEAQELSKQLQRALDSRIIIEQAKGIVSRDQQVSVDAAFELLRRYSRNTNTPLRDVATAVVNDGLTMPPV